MRYFIEFSYNGKNYHGWQLQPKAITVQGVLQNALTTILREEISVIGAGRTDSGVHALQMFAHFDTERELSDDLVRKLNAFLPYDIAVHSICAVKPDAHARFDALKRTYQYHISIDGGKGSLVGGVSGEDVVMGAVGQGRGFLGNTGDAPVRRQAVVAAIGFEIVAQEGEQGAFAAAVATGEADTLAGVNADIGVFDEVFAVARQGEVVEFDHGAVSHCMSGSSPSACGKR